MADSNRLGHYPEHRASAYDGRTDPLAELARIIGQGDPFAQVERERRVGTGHGEPATGAHPAPDLPSAAHDPAAPQGWAFAPAHGYGDPRADVAAGGADHAGGYAGHAGYAGYAAEPGPYDDAAEAAAEELEFQEAEARRRQRRRTLLVAAVLGLAVMGTAGAYGYRTFVLGSDTPAAPPPIIKADAAPSKVVPVTHTGNLRTGQDADRTAGRSGAGEALLPREEAPVEIKRVAVAPAPPNAYAPDDPVAALPGPTAPTVPVVPANPVNPVVPVAPATDPPGSLTAPKRVRTVTIRSDMTVIAEPAVPPLKPAPATSAPPSRAQPNEGRTRAVAPAASSPAPPAPRPEMRPARDPATPLSLTPGATPAPMAPARPQSAPAGTGAPLQLSAVAPNKPAAATASAGGAYAVQLSSQRSQAEAEATFRVLQNRYPNLLGGRQPIIRRVDLGERGTFYRAMVGPFANSEQASELCNALKAAGGQCFIQRN